MNTTVQPEAPTASPAPREQRTSTFLHIETMNDLDDGRPTLVAATETNLGDLRETSPARVLDMVEEAHAALDALARMAREFEARDTLAAIVAEHHLQIEEWDTTDLDPQLRDRLMAWHWVENGEHVVVVPEGQDPVERLGAITSLLNRFGAPEDQA